MMRAIISRFAPAPTGFLHLGHIVNAATVWRETRARGGRILLRIEDHDRQRSRPEFEAAILEDLAWLGFAADEPPVRQSERGLVYACACSRADIAEAGPKGPALHAEIAARRNRRPDPKGPALHSEIEAANCRPGPFGPGVGDAELRYPGTCRDRGLPEKPGFGVRVRLEPTVEHFVDLRHGAQAQRPSEQCGDLLIRDREGNWTYQFAATVDDYVQGVTLVIRGDDLLVSAGRQIQLARMLGRHEPPEFLHHPLIMKSSDQKLSKSDRDTGIRELRAAGWTSTQVIERALSMVSR